MSSHADRLRGVQVLLTGAGAPITCDVVRLLATEDALVTAADENAAVLARLQRDLGLYRTTVKTALVDLQNLTEMRLFADNLQGLGLLPHLIICCCDGKNCPADLAASLLQPSLFVHALPIARWRLLRLVDAMSIPSLPQLLDQRRLRGMPLLRDRSVRVSIAGHPFSVDRCTHPPEPTLDAPGPRQAARALRIVGQAPHDRLRHGRTATPNPGRPWWQAETV
ncbi:MAG: hypothetical protein JWP35_2257 [Caulobacter sp.]|nr:hypothetical protein [Caulobacter sp.]